MNKSKVYLGRRLCAFGNLNNGNGLIVVKKFFFNIEEDRFLVKDVYFAFHIVPFELTNLQETLVSFSLGPLLL